jgi:predicted ATP-dependent serine protease
MSWIRYDPDEWKVVHESRPCASCGGDMSKCDGRCTGYSSWSTVRRSDEEIREIKRQKREEHERRVLAEAELIKARRNIP